ncbi:E3 ubiquitin-protein ligase PPP1R11 isoform X2 [Periplaneta americana]|uniref:E3 ubiquitin-protein ligase PPP1R11 isoform X2 n=1 Tax=Periplaneta americana TaxID=6978 RepID=UPI0037E9433A
MAEQTRASTPAEATVTLVESEEDHLQQDVRTVRLRLRKPESKKKVQWQSGTVDNEHLNKKKSKCCCQYEKPRVFGESSSSSEDEECENCHGHVERKKKKKKEPPGSTEDSAEPGKQVLDHFM